MRLTAVIEDLNTWLKKANEKTTFVESQLQRAQMSIVAERASSAEKIRAMSAQLGAAHNTEAQLRTELSNASKAAAAHKATIPKFEAAVAAAVAADGIAEKSRQEVEDLKEQLSEQTDKAEKAAQQAAAFKDQNVAISDKVAELEVQFAEAKESQKRALEERDSVAELLRVATEKMNSVSITEPVAPCATCDSCSSASSSVEAANVDAGIKPVAPEAQVKAPVVEEASPEKASVPSNYPDPIKMHARYNRLRDAILKVSACIVAIESGEAQSDKLDELRTKRDELFKRAKELKFRYDTIFGAVDPKSVVEFTTTPSKSTNDDSMEDISFLPEGDAPSPPFTHIVSFAKEMAQSCSLGGAFDFGSYDSGVPIGNHLVAPIMSGAPTEPTDGHDAKNEMVNAVVADLTNFLKDVKRRDAEIEGAAVVE